MRSALLPFIVLLPSLAAAQIPVLRVSPASLSFTATGGSTQPPPQEVRVRNSGSGVLAWQAVSSVPWLRVSPPSGSAPSTLAVSIDPSRMSPGPHSGRVTVSAVGDADDSPAVVDVTVEIGRQTPVAAPRPGASSAGAESPLILTAPAGSSTAVTSTVELEGPSGTSIGWTARPDQPWLSVEPSRGSTPARITVTAQPAALPTGDHQATVQFINDDNEPWLVVPVTLSIRPPAGNIAAPADAAAPAAAPPLTPLAIPTTTLPPASRNLPYSQAIPVKGGRPPYTVRILQGRLPLGLTLANGAISGLTRFSGNYQLSVVVSDSSTPPQIVTQQLTLRVIVLLRDTALMVGPPSISLSVVPGQRSQGARLTVESGAQPLTWQATTDAPWLKLTPTQGASPSYVQLEVNLRGLAPGVYTGTVTVTMEGAPNSPARIPVQLTIRK